MFDFDTPSGTLVLPTEPFEIPAPAASWFDNPVVSWSVVVSLLVFIVCFKDTMSFLPYMLQAMARWKPNVTIQHSLHLSSSRWTACAGVTLPFCLVASKYSLFLHEFWAPALLLALILLGKLLAYSIIRRRRLSNEYWKAARNTFITFFPALVGQMLATEALNLILKLDSETMRLILLAECGMVYLLSMVREFQILKTGYKPLISFLYLCGLEILSIGMVAVAAITLQ